MRKAIAVDNLFIAGDSNVDDLNAATESPLRRYC
jgi:hypothetical protein